MERKKKRKEKRKERTDKKGMEQKKKRKKKKEKEMTLQFCLGLKDPDKEKGGQSDFQTLPDRSGDKKSSSESEKYSE